MRCGSILVRLTTVGNWRRVFVESMRLV